MFDDAKTIKRHLAIQTESKAGYVTPMRPCWGERCKGQRHSISQFKDENVLCKICVLRGG